MDISIAVCNRILELCEKNDLTINKLANMSGLPPSSLKNILYRKSKNPKIRTIKIICDGLGISLSEFFQSDDFDSLDQEIK